MLFRINIAGIYVIVLICILPNILWAQRYPFHDLGVDDGLIQSQAICMTQDRIGNLWIGTLGGLSKYDGINFTNYTINNGLLNNMIYALATDDSGNIWMGSPTDLCRYNGKTFSHYKVKNGAVQSVNSSQQIQVAGDSVWWRVAGELHLLTKGKLHDIPTPAPPGKITSFLAAPHELWVAGDTMLYHQVNNKWDTLLLGFSAEQMTPKIIKIYRDRHQNIFLGTNRGLFRVVQNKIAAITLDSAMTNLPNYYTSFAEDKEGTLWLGTSVGVIKISPGNTNLLTGNKVAYYNKSNGLSDNYFYDVLADKEGNIWMASDGQGIFRFSGTLFTSLDETMGLPSAQISAITANPHDSLFLGTFDAGLYIFNAGKIRSLPFPTAHAPSISALCYTTGSKLWIGTKWAGLWKYDGKIFRQYTAEENDLPSNQVTALYEDPDHRLWMGFPTGILVYDHELFKKISDKNTIVRSFLLIGKDSMLIVTEKGLELYAGDVLSDFITHAAPDSNAILCAIKKGNELWLGSSDNGIIRYDMHSHKSLVINKARGMHSDFIYTLITDNDGNIWAGTGFGIHKISFGSEDMPAIDFYGKAQGITGMESNHNAVFKLPDGSIWFGTTNGAIHYQPSAKAVSSLPVSVVLQSVKLIGENTIDQKYYDSTDNWYNVPYHLRLPYRKNNITFTFRGITLSSAQQMSYRYHLHGIEDTSWSDWSPINSVTFSALPPGKYVFHVQCAGGDGNNSNGKNEIREFSYEFEIITPFHQTVWFRFVVLFGCIISGISLQYIITKNKQRKKKLLEKLREEEQAKVRMRTAEDFHDEIGNKLTRIKVLTNVLKNKMSPQPDAARILMQIEDNTSQLYGGMRDILWSLKPSNDVLYEILHHICDFANEIFGDTDVHFTFTGTDEQWRNYRLPMDMSRNLIMIFKEAFNNILKYANAKQVSFDVEIKKKNVLHILLKDDGAGFDMKDVQRGNGLKNMQLRAERMGGRLYIDSRQGKGTTISLTFKIPPKR